MNQILLIAFSNFSGDLIQLSINFQFKVYITNTCHLFAYFKRTLILGSFVNSNLNHISSIILV